MLRLRYPKMIVDKIRVANFRSFENQTFHLDRFNVVIGANASGKSNFISIFQFLKDLVVHGLDNAVSMQGGIPFLRNINIESEQPLQIEMHIVASEGENKQPYLYRPRHITAIRSFNYLISISFHKRGYGYSITEEELKVEVIINLSDERGIKPATSEGVGAELSMKREGSRLLSNIKPLNTEKIPEEVKEYLQRYTGRGYRHLSKKVSFIETGPFDEFTYTFSRFIREFSVYDFDPKLCKQASQITGKIELEPNGCNLAIVLSSIMKNRKQAKRFTTLVKSLLPFVDGMKVESRADKSLLTSIDESYSKRLLPAPFISDGTINLTALIVALYFEEKPFIVIEEPERNIHPQLISRIISMMKDVSENKQIIVTTHNPEVVRNTGLSDLLLLRRNERGFSIVSRPEESDEVKTFLSKDLGLDDLYVDNLLEW